MDFGTFLRIRRLQVKLSPEARAALAHTDRTQLLRVEAGMTPPPDVQTLLELVAALCLNLEDATTFLDLAHQAMARHADLATPTPADPAGGGLHKRLSKAPPAPRPQTQTRQRRPGPATIVRGLRASLAPTDQP